MALTQRQYEVLAEMGIPVWERRHPPVLMETQLREPVVAETLREGADADVELLGRCVVVLPHLPATEAEHKLLTAMLRTISLSMEQIDLLDEATFQGLGTESLQSKAVLSIGAIQQDQLYCDSLKTLLVEPQRKAAAWQVLKQLAQQIK